MGRPRAGGGSGWVCHPLLSVTPGDPAPCRSRLGAEDSEDTPGGGARRDSTESGWDLPGGSLKLLRKAGETLLPTASGAA